MKKIVLIISIFVLCIFGIIITKNLISKNNIEDTEVLDETEEELEWWIEESKRRNEIIEKEYVSEEMIIELTKSNPNWSQIDIPNENLNRIKEKYPNGIFNGEEYDEVKLKESYNSLVHDSEMGGDIFVLVAKRENKVDEWTVYGECGDILSKDRFGIYTVIKKSIYDESGSRIKYPMDEEHWIDNIHKIALQDDEEVGKSEDFYERYPNFTGILNPYHHKETHTHIEWLDGNFDNREVYCNVYYALLREDYKLKITYATDDKNYLKDYKVDVIEKSEHYFKSDNFKDPNNSEVTLRLIYKDRDWSKLPITNNFLKKFNNKDGIFPGFQVINFSGINLQKGNGNKHALELTLLDGTKKYVGLIYKIVDNKIDDIEIKFLPDDDYSKYTKEEIYGMF